MKIIICSIVFIWMYHRIGVLYYKLANKGTNPPRLWLFLFSKLSKGTLHWLIGSSAGGAWRLIKLENGLRYLIYAYIDVWIWPIKQGKIFFKKLWSNIYCYYHLIMRTAQKDYLKKDKLMVELKSEFNAKLKKYKIIGAKWAGGKYKIYIKLPRPTWNILGPWKENKGEYFLVSAFQKDAPAVLRLPDVMNNKLAKTKEVVVEIYRGEFINFSDHSFDQIKWERWKNDFIGFFQNLVLS